MIIVRVLLIATLFANLHLGTRVSADDLIEQAARVLEQHCLRCHDAAERAGELSLTVDPRDEGESQWKPDLIMKMVNPSEGRAEMPKESPPLSQDDLEVLGRWVAEGAKWPQGRKLAAVRSLDTSWWSLQPLPDADQARQLLYDAQARATKGQLTSSTNPIDCFVADQLQQHALGFSPQADRRTLIRRLYYDLVGLPPTPDEILQFESDSDPDAYEKLVSRLLDSPRYGERWSRHWLDVVHFADTHGYDKDKPRPNAWPYRDYVIRSLNQDKPWARFLQEQIAGDVLFPESVDGILALGFLSAGPWDFVGHAEVAESKIDGKIARHLDRDDVVRTVIQSSMSLTIGCAQCHDHKFDPISQLEYYRLQAVFSAIDRTDRAYFDDADKTREYQQLADEKRRLEDQVATINKNLTSLNDEKLKELDRLLKESGTGDDKNVSAEFGYHSQLEDSADRIKWVQVDLLESKAIQRVTLHPAFDLFNNIGYDFCLPPKLKLELSNDQNFANDAQTKYDLVLKLDASGKANALVVRNRKQTEETATLVSRLPGEPIVIDTQGINARFVRVTATQLAPRLSNDYCFALSELEVFNQLDENVAKGCNVSSLDSIEAPVRWQRSNLVDGKFPLSTDHALPRAQLVAEREARQKQLLGDEKWRRFRDSQDRLIAANGQIASLGKPKLVYAGSVHWGTGAFTGTGSTGGKPREIHLLHRGNVTEPRELVAPGSLSIVPGLPADLRLGENQTEGDRRAALARWITSEKNTLTWRSIVNRVWQYHFGVGLVDTPNDFGRMGGKPSHPELLDWLAVQFRDRGQSIKDLHRMILTSQTYQQSCSGPNDELIYKRCISCDIENRMLWRANRRKLDAESIRDSILQLSGKLDLTMGGPGFQEFVIEKPEHSPHYRYELHDFEKTDTHRRTIYRFTVRSQLQPFLNSLDCADPSIQVATRNQSQSPLQALAMLNNGLVLVHSRHFAEKLVASVALDKRTAPSSTFSLKEKQEAKANLEMAIQRGYEEVTGRKLRQVDVAVLAAFVEKNGLAAYCRMLLNLNEFMFVD